MKVLQVSTKDRGGAAISCIRLHQGLLREGEASKGSEVLGRFTHVVIPYGLDTDVFKRRDPGLARELLQWPKDKKLILFVPEVVTNQRKGFVFLQQALQGLHTGDGLPGGRHGGNHSAGCQRLAVH